MRTTLRKARTGYYEIRWTEKDGRTRTVSTRTRNLVEARAFRAAWLNAQLAAGVNAAAKVYVRDVVDAYVRGHIAKRTRMDAQAWSLKQIRAFLGGFALTEITPTIVSEYRQHRAAVKDGTVRRELGALLAAANWCVRERIISQDLVPVIQMPANSPPRKTFLDEAQEKALWEHAVRDWRQGKKSPGRRAGLFVAIALDTAARKEAIETLTWDRVDFVHGTIDFNDPNVRVSRKKRAIVPIANRLKPLLMEAMVAQGHSGNTTGFVLGSGGDVRNSFRRLVEDAGYPWLRIHDLRRTAATLMLRNGVDVWLVAGVLGDSVATVTRNYGVHVPAHLTNAVNRVATAK